MRILYFDCFSGISGDMTVAALLDLGVPEEYLISNLSRLGISDEYGIRVKKGIKNGIQGTDFYVDLKNEHVHIHPDEHTHDNGEHDHDRETHEHFHNEHHHEHEHSHDHGEHSHHHKYHHARNLFDIEGLIDKSELNANIKSISKNIFKIVAEAEAKVHGKGIYDVHFHEVGAVDSIVDIVGTAICIDYIKPDRIISSPVNTGSGFVKCQHGLIPVPAPATVNILKNVPIYCDERKFELTTPTGAAILKALTLEFKKMPPMKIKRVGYGCGKRDTEKPNVLRVILAEEDSSDNCILEATIDDMNPQIYGYMMDKLFEAGARDVYLSPVYMKKNRPGIVVTITTPIDREEQIKETLFKETTTIGIRRFNIERTELEREFKSVYTEYGDIKFKISRYKDNVVNISPEFEDLKRAAESKNIPLKEIYRNISGISKDMMNR